VEKGLTAISDEEPKFSGPPLHPAVNTTKKRFANARDGYIGSAISLRRGGDMAEGFVHTVRANGRWTNSLEGQDRALLGTFETKEEAVEAGRKKQDVAGQSI
jgi:hypothetical protein